VAGGSPGKNDRSQCDISHFGKGKNLRLGKQGGEKKGKYEDLPKMGSQRRNETNLASIKKLTEDRFAGVSKKAMMMRPEKNHTPPTSQGQEKKARDIKNPEPPKRRKPIRPTRRKEAVPPMQTR